MVMALIDFGFPEGADLVLGLATIDPLSINFGLVGIAVVVG